MDIVQTKRRIPDRRTPTKCPTCERGFLRDRNTDFCSDECRFLAKVRTADSSTCWTWTATLDQHGYGTFYMAGRNWTAHRAALALFSVLGDPDLHADHLCRNRACVNPEHIELVPQRTNTLRGNAPSAVAWRENRCKNGHRRTAENTYVRNGRHRQCRVCMTASRAKREGRAA